MGQDLVRTVAEKDVFRPEAVRGGDGLLEPPPLRVGVKAKIGVDPLPEGAQAGRGRRVGVLVRVELDHPFPRGGLLPGAVGDEAADGVAP